MLNILNTLRMIQIWWWSETNAMMRLHFAILLLVSETMSEFRFPIHSAGECVYGLHSLVYKLIRINKWLVSHRFLLKLLQTQILRTTVRQPHISFEAWRSAMCTEEVHIDSKAKSPYYTHGKSFHTFCTDSYFIWFRGCFYIVHTHTHTHTYVPRKYKATIERHYSKTRDFFL